MGQSLAFSSMKQLLILISMLALTIGTSWGWTEEPLRNYPKALEVAKKQGKPVFVYVYDSQ